MAKASKTVRYISDGTFSLDELHDELEAHGAMVGQDDGAVKFVPDDPTFPTTLFGRDGVIEMLVKAGSETRLDLYIEELGRWLSVKLQPVPGKR